MDVCFKLEEVDRILRVLSPEAPGTGPTSFCAAPRPSPGQHAPGPEPPVSVGSLGWRNDPEPVAADQTAQKPGRFQHGRQSLYGVPEDTK